MVVTYSRKITIHKVLEQLKTDYPNLNFSPNRTFYWSPKHHIIYYAEDQLDNNTATWSLLHELSHAVLGHTFFESDFELLLMEVAAWQKAQEIAKTYNVTIDPDHIEDCVDTYRDWLYQRSTCPNCTNCSLQKNRREYHCHNCNSTWMVSASRLCRPYRRTQKALA